ncbi:ABC transporter ATP-binding protein [Apilactobacillus micheneri]|uniref:ABC transporter ATP-binding protein n=1 Tax=Apilactobacillus micheneri TaxID=1899430 RepID=A0ABY2YZF9_9LACO|nr:ABC transporter ATP-binding protein [Apilactobacillus micheneri]TPR26335.1 ABC transporter ATP-binding protein [Apilactobacillus micheneri]TPR27089.1 ABC transporter ATP-binding protein [Apilactobacillus micheneri]TPR27336.1 ABC transporter ATP-binding protein [Apilactobacillus micheneri]TPR31852.1 ABC transporter ATP-binding protein [Apilactobacillus micheneri]TPR32256.1 ABC transporter ATP-binding protein [Apilactobacillus micheneri]
MKMIELNQINKIYGTKLSKTTALSDINFSADQGEMITVTGPSGSGKSTFIKILGGILSPTSGSVKINGQDYEALSKKAQSNFRLNNISFVLQSYNLLPYLKVKDQFELANRVKEHNNIKKSSFDDLIDELGLKDLLNHYPDELSGGQQQRVAIARAVYTNPKIILADEPTAALDGKRAIEVMEQFRKLAHEQNKLIILITHDDRLIKYADKNYQIVDGKGKFVGVDEKNLV